MMKTEIGILLVRLVTGITFLIHGLDKFHGGIEGTGEFFESLGIPAPMVMAGVVAIVEIVGGLALILGLGTRIFGAIFSIVMVTAIFTAKAEAGFLGGYELDLILLTVSLLLLLNGSKLIALDQLFKRKKRRSRF